MSPERSYPQPDSSPPGNAKGALLREIMASEAVPRPALQALGDQVFVPRKLLALVEQAEDHRSFEGLAGAPRHRALQSMVRSCWMPPYEAVTLWGLQPRDHEVLDTDDGLTIRHQIFNARVPEFYFSWEELHAALACMLMGLPVGDGGDFMFAGQGYVALEPYGVDALPPLPGLLLPLVSQAKTSGNSALQNVAHCPGFPLLTEEAFARLLLADLQRSRIEAVMDGRLAQEIKPWHLIQRVSLARLNDRTGEALPVDAPGLVQELRAIYPELAELDTVPLLALHAAFQRSCGFWDTDLGKDPRLLRYVLGQLTTEAPLDGKAALDAGTAVAYALLAGQPADAALAVGHAWAEHNQALQARCWRASEVMRWLAVRG